LPWTFFKEVLSTHERMFSKDLMKQNLTDRLKLKINILQFAIE
jgi:hypothetical protein